MEGIGLSQISAFEDRNEEIETVVCMDI